MPFCVENMIAMRILSHIYIFAQHQQQFWRDTNLLATNVASFTTPFSYSCLIALKKNMLLLALYYRICIFRTVTTNKLSNFLPTDFIFVFWSRSVCPPKIVQNVVCVFSLTNFAHHSGNRITTLYISVHPSLIHYRIWLMSSSAYRQHTQKCISYACEYIVYL